MAYYTASDCQTWSGKIPADEPEQQFRDRWLWRKKTEKRRVSRRE